MKCGACGRSYRKGSMVYVAAGTSLRQTRACQACVKLAVAIVPRQAPTQCACGDVADVCGKCKEKAVDKAARGADAKKAAAAIRKLAEAYKRAPDESEQEHQDGRVAGLLQAADLLEKGTWARA